MSIRPEASFWLSLLALALWLALMVFNAGSGRFQRRYPESRRLCSRSGRLTMARCRAVVDGSVFAYLGSGSLLGWL